MIDCSGELLCGNGIYAHSRWTRAKSQMQDVLICENELAVYAGSAAPCRRMSCLRAIGTGC